MMDESRRPLVSVVTPVLNGAGHLLRCIESVRAQSQDGVEHIVVDGGSTDGTQELLRASGVRHVTGPDAGLYDAMSRGIRMARGEFVHILNADDRYASTGALAILVSALVDRQLDLVHARARQVRTDGSEVRVFGRDATVSALRRKMVVAHPTVVVRRRVYERFGTFSVGFRIAADHEWMLRVWPRITVGYLDQVLVDMSVGGISTSNANVVRAYRESMAAALIHGTPPMRALITCWYEIAKHRLFFRRRYSAPPALQKTRAAVHP